MVGLRAGRPLPPPLRNAGDDVAVLLDHILSEAGLSSVRHDRESPGRHVGRRGSGHRGGDECGMTRCGGIRGGQPTRVVPCVQGYSQSNGLVGGAQGFLDASAGGVRHPARAVARKPEQKAASYKNAPLALPRRGSTTSLRACGLDHATCSTPQTCTPSPTPSPPPAPRRHRLQNRNRLRTPRAKRRRRSVRKETGDVAQKQRRCCGPASLRTSPAPALRELFTSP
jgi:hypothetical protein